MKLLPNLFALALLLLCASPLAAQNPSKTTITGQIKDTTGTVMPFATVMLLNPVDTTLVNFTRSDDNGAFAFKNVRNTAYLFKISYIGFLPYQQHLEPASTAIYNLGDIQIKPIAHELMEVVIKTAKAPLRIHGDTIEYDASTFKVPPGSTVEDLLRRLPGIEVDADGNIKAQGQDIKRVYVDGKTFFGDDPKSATKNLGAETISKVQVYNEKSEQAKLTGVDDGKKEKTMNLELKDEFKKGAFGKITGAVGTEDRWAARGNYNRFNEKQQLSFIGYGNNINQTGVNWEDYGEFKGQNAFNDYDNGDFGFGGGGGRMYYFGEGGDSPINNFDGRGFTQNFGAGANYNFDNKKTKYNASYFYNQTDLDLKQYGYKQTFLSDNSYFNNDTITQHDFRSNHSFATRLEHEIDSLDILIVKANLKYNQSSSDFLQNQLFSAEDGSPTNSLNLDNQTGSDSWRLTSAGIFRHRFKKKGRSFAISGGYNNNTGNGDDNLFSLNNFFGANDFTEQIRQLNDKSNATQQVKSSIIYTEPISKVIFWETFGNFSRTGNEVNRQALDPENNLQRINALSVFYSNTVQYVRGGTDVRYSDHGMNLSVGLALQQLDLNGEYSLDRGFPPLTDPINRRYRNWVPYFDLSNEFKNNIWLNSSYSYGIREPNFSDLQPVPNVNNPAFRTIGNPDLSPERFHDVNLSVNYWNPANFSNLGLGVNYARYDNKIVYSQTVELVDSLGYRTTTRPENVAGGSNFDVYLWTGFPIVKTKLTTYINGNVTIGQTPAFVNGVQNETGNLGYGGNVGFNFTPNQKLVLGLNGFGRFNNISYSIQSELNQDIYNFGAGSDLKWQFIDRTFLESNFNYTIYRNETYGFNQELPIWNASLRRLVGKKNKIELRLAAFDLLNKRVSIKQFGDQNYVTRNIAETLARYYMLSVSYNVRGYENKIKKNEWW